MLTVVRNGKFTGTQYNETKPNIIKFHQNKGEKLVWIDRKLRRDEEGNVIEKPTAEDLENEITEAQNMREVAQRLSIVEQGIGANGYKGERRLASRLDDIEDRLKKLEEG